MLKHNNSAQLRPQIHQLHGGNQKRIPDAVVVNLPLQDNRVQPVPPPPSGHPHPMDPLPLLTEPLQLVRSPWQPKRLLTVHLPHVNATLLGSAEDHSSTQFESGPATGPGLKKLRSSRVLYDIFAAPAADNEIGKMIKIIPYAINNQQSKSF